jgi:anti-sigma B factor antagonist
MAMATREDGIARVDLVGDIDIETSPQWRSKLLGLIRTGKSLVVNMGAVRSIDSAGIATLVDAYQRTRHAGLRFSLEEVGGPALRVLELARLTRVFPMRQDNVQGESAVAA